MSEKLGQEPAFPIEAQNAPYLLALGYAGMTKRFYAACAAMQACISCGAFNLTDTTAPYFIAEKAYDIADELLNQENQ